VGADTRKRALRLGGKAYLDGRSWQALRIKQLVKQWSSQLNVRADSSLVPALRAVAELQTILEMKRAELLAKGTGDLPVVVRLENELRRKLERLGLDQVAEPAQQQRQPSLAERLAQADQAKGKEPRR
jgi:hypothetical protein